MNKTKKIITLVLSIFIVISIFTTINISVCSDDVVVATGELNYQVRYPEFKTGEFNGHSHTPRRYSFSNTSGTGAIDYSPAYCINPNADFPGDLTSYKGYLAQDSTWLNSLSTAAQKGIIEIATFAYPARRLTDIGVVNEADAIAAAQLLIWEYCTGTRTTYTGDATNYWAADGLSTQSSQIAYRNILNAVESFYNQGGTFEQMKDNVRMIFWDNGAGAQQMVTFTGSTPIVPEKNGYIEVRKSDAANGRGLIGAEFTVYDSDGNVTTKIGPTDADGYAITEGGAKKPLLLYGTYRVVETKFPENYTATGPTSWTVTLSDANNGHVLINAMNSYESYVKIIKTADTALGDLIKNKQFGVFKDNDVKIMTLTTDTNGNTSTVKLPGIGTYYVQELNAEGCTTEFYNNTTDKWEVKNKYYFTTPDDCDGNGIVNIKVKNTANPGILKIQKTSEDGIVAGFKFNIKSFGSDAVNINGITDGTGLVTVEKSLYETTVKSGLTVSDFNNACAPEFASLPVARMIMVKQPWTTAVEVSTYYDDTYKIINLANSQIIPRDDKNKSIGAIHGLMKDGQLYAIFNIRGGISEIIQSPEDPYGTSFINAYASQQVIDEVTAAIGKKENTFTPNASLNWLQFYQYDVDGDKEITEKDIALLQESYNNQKPIGNVPLTLPTGAYIITEQLTSEQSRYINPGKRIVFIKPDKTTVCVINNNIRKTGIYIIKQSEDGIVANIKFHIKGKLESGQTFELTANTDEDGVLFAVKDNNNLAVQAGTYTITELDVDGRYITPEPQTVVITGDWLTANPDTSVYVTFENKLKPVDIVIKKTSEDGEIAGIVFNISGSTNKGEAVNINVETGSDGTITKSMSSGTYIISEIMNETRKYVDTEPQKISPYIDSTGNTIDNIVSFNNILKKFTLTVNKQDGLTGQVEGNGTLEGAVYGLYKNGELVETAETKADGSLTFGKKVCEIGYTVSEITPSEGYMLDTTVYDVNSNPASFNNDNNDISINVTEAPIMGTVTIVKRKGYDKNYLMEPGAEFQIYLKSAGTYDSAKDTQRDIIITDDADPDDPQGYDGGVGVSKNLPYGTYVIHQIKGDENFEFISDFEVEITADKLNESYVKVNKPIPHPVIITKTDITGEKTIPGAIISIYDSEEIMIYEDITDNDGQIKNIMLMPGTYTFKETVTANGYAINTSTMTFTVDLLGNITGDTKIKDDVSKYVVLKTGEDNNVLTGATFELINSDTKVSCGTKTSKEDGLAVFESIPFGNYEIHEIAVPDGYTLSKQVIKFTMDNHWTNKDPGKFDTVFVNDKTVVTITKTDITGEKTIPGASIEIYDKNGQIVYKNITDEDGTITAIGLLSGTYTFKETLAPNGYALNPNTMTFTIDTDGNVTGDTTIKDDFTLYKFLKVDKNKNVLSGAVFTMFDKNGNTYATAISDENGIVSFKGFQEGKYVIKETKCPDGYTPSNRIIEIENNGKWTNAENDTSINTFENVKVPEVPKTGDTTNIDYSVIMLMVGFAGIFIIQIIRRKQKI